jgi:hypothetical protein
MALTKVNSTFIKNKISMFYTICRYLESLLCCKISKNSINVLKN